MQGSIETKYNGYRFRSRLEARWAVFFDVMGIYYIYEPEGFERKIGIDPGLETIRYLPDFYLPDYRLYAEVKAARMRSEIKDDDEYRMSWLIDFNGPLADGLIMLGYIPDAIGAETMCYAVQRWSGKSLEWGYIEFSDYPDMSRFEGYDHHTAPCTFDANDDLILTGSVICAPTMTGTLVEKALMAARSARFEHGEKPIFLGGQK